ncbi:amino acid adenylation domain-containing protein [Clostridium cavendishii DSM 21758]|uniref:Amino acid adenylation domain-containing protein n=2 Tax=Clostridium TaxID=1485 RepID=A0A1M6FNV4_9CLOT|nr:amino acid adenylation domain-containing protein [Clostridium cavendishii DSM 21758]
MSFKDLLISINKSFLESNEYDFYPLAKIQSFSEVKEKLINNIMVFENYPVDDKGLNTELLVKNDLEIVGSSGSEQTNYNFNIMVVYQDKILVKFLFNESLYSKNNVERIKEHFINLTDEIIKNENILVKDIEILGEDEKNTVLVEFNNTKVDYQKNKTIQELFENQVKKTPDKVAIVFDNKKLTYKELNEKVNILGLKLREIGVKPNDFVAIMADRSLEMVIGILAIIKSGGAYVPIDPKYPEDRVNYILSDCNPKALLTYKASTNIIGIPIINLSDKKAFTGDFKDIKNVNKADDLLYLIYTSGTTGKPKGVMIKHSNMVNYCSNNEKSIATSIFNSKLNNMGSVTNMTFDIFATEIILVFVNGMTTFIAKSDEQEDAFYLSAFVERNNIEILQTTPSRIKILLSHPEKLKTLKSLKYIMIGGEKVERDIVAKLHEYTNAIIQNVYGPSETTVWSTANELSKNMDKDNISIGRPIANTQIYILQKVSLCGIGIPGELCIAGDGVTKGYLNKPELTEEKFINNPYGEGKLYRTGDLARWLPDGNIEFLGRIDEQVKVRGFRIELEEIANVLRKINYIKDVAVITRENSNGEKSIYSYVISDINVDFKQIKKELRKELPEYMIPTYMMQIKEIPVNRNGKLDKKALPDINLESTEEYIAPRNKKEETICKIIAEILEINRVGLQDNFFELGGDSMKLLRLISALRKEGFDVGFDIIKRSNNIKTLVEILCTINDKCFNKKLKDENQIAINITSVPMEIEGDFINSTLYKELNKYNTNIYNATKCKQYVPLKVQEDFLIKESPFISALGIEILGKVSKTQILKSINNIMNSQAVLRTVYDSKNNILIELQKKDWYIPCFSKDEYNEVYNNLGGVSKCEKLFKTSDLLSKIIIIEKDTDNYLVYFYMNHAIWDFFTAQILLDMFKNTLLNHDKACIPEETYYEYVNRKRHHSKIVKMYNSIENIENNVETYIKSIKDNYNYLYKIIVTKQINQIEKKEIIEKPVEWILDKYCKIININDIMQIPFTMIYHSREAKTLNTLGLYADTIPCLYNINKKEVIGWNKEEKISNNSNESYELYKEKVPTKSNIFNELSVNVLISDSNKYNNNLKNNDIMITGKYAVGDVPEEIHMNINKNTLTIFCPIYSEKSMTEETIENMVKKIFNII